jgi:hypothetical protein
MTDESPSLSVRPYGDRWAVLVGDEVVLVSQTQESAESVVVTANDVLSRSGIARGPERRSFSGDED